jgi:nucleotide-binding universal stress UspA family protein
MLIAVDGSKHSLDTVKYAIQHARWYREALDVELLYVQPPLPYEGRAGAVVGQEPIRRYYQEEGEAALVKPRELLEAAGIHYTPHTLVGPVAESIVQLAKQLNCDQIVIGTHGRTAAAAVIMGSVATEVLNLSAMPVLLVR